MADNSEARKRADERRGEGESVATYWARILHECEVTGEPVEIANKFGEVVAVMVSKAVWDDLQADMTELFDRRAGSLGG